MIKRRFIGLALLAGSVLPLLAQDVTIDSPDEKPYHALPVEVRFHIRSFTMEGRCWNLLR